MVKIGFDTDKNLLKKTKEELYSSNTLLDSTDIFIEYIDALNKGASKNQLIYFMPRLIIEELFSQKRSAFNEQYNSLKEKFQYMNYALKGEMPQNNIEEILQKEKEHYLSKYKVIDLKYTDELFQKLISDAIRKNPPFDKTFEGKKTDAGFKDALIWETILLSEDIDECEQFYFFSSDKVFIENKEYLSNEFKEQHPNTNFKIRYFESNGNQRQNALNTIIEENHLIKTNVIKLYNKDHLLTTIKLFSYNYSKDVIYSNEEQVIKLKNILFDKFTNDDFIIEDVNEIEDKYEVIVSFKTKKYTLDNNQEKFNSPLFGKMKIYFKYYNNNFKYETFTIYNVGFYFNDIKQLIAKIGNSISKIYSEYSYNIAETLKKYISDINEVNYNILLLKNINDIDCSKNNKDK